MTLPESRHEERPVPNAVPNHVGVIPDGFRRWAREHNVPESVAYRHGIDAIGPMIETLFAAGVQELSLYFLSRDNLSRHSESLDATINGLRIIFDEVLPSIIRRWDAHIVHAGSVLGLPTDFVRSLSDVCSTGSEPAKRSLYLCVGYSPEEELLQACQMAARTGKPLIDCLWVPSPVDFVIRTSGEARLSNFLPFQCGYAELAFLPEFFPDIRPRHIDDALDEFARRRRRFGQ